MKQQVADLSGFVRNLAHNVQGTALPDSTAFRDEVSVPLGSGGPGVATGGGGAGPASARGDQDGAEAAATEESKAEGKEEKGEEAKEGNGEGNGEGEGTLGAFPEAAKTKKRVPRRAEPAQVRRQPRIRRRAARQGCRTHPARGPVWSRGPLGAGPKPDDSPPSRPPLLAACPRICHEQRPLPRATPRLPLAAAARHIARPTHALGPRAARPCALFDGACAPGAGTVGATGPAGAERVRLGGEGAPRAAAGSIGGGGQRGARRDAPGGVGGGKA